MKKLIYIFTFLSLILLMSCQGTKTVTINVRNGNVKKHNLVFRENFTSPDKNRFSIAIIPDVQGYTHFSAQDWRDPDLKYGYIFSRQTQFIAEHSVKNGGDFSCAIQVGDLVHEKGNLKSEWEIAQACMSNLIDQLPLLIVPGNHDYDKWVKGNNIDGSSSYNFYFGPDSVFFKNKEWYGGSSADGRNSWITFSACGYNFLVIGLEILPSKQSLEWAQQVINEHKGWPTIYVNHEILKVSHREPDEPLENAEYTSTRSREIFEHTSPEDVWNEFISTNDQIFLAICGHSSSMTSGSALRIDTNVYNHTTYTILSDYQDTRSYLSRNAYEPYFLQFCGDGWMTILDFDLDENEMYVHTYSTEFDEFRTDNYAELTLPIDWDWNLRFYKEAFDSVDAK